MPPQTSARRPRSTNPPSSGQILRLPLPESDQALIALVQAGNTNARRDLVERYAEDVERILYRILGPDPEIEDLMQEVFLVALKSLASLRDASALRSWLGGIAVRKARKLIRRRQRWRFIQFVSPAELPESAAALASPEVSEALRATYAILGRLPADECIAFALRHIEGMDLTAMADVTRVSLATVKRRLTRAHARFIEYARDSDALLGFLSSEGFRR
jgi:RNA polymerase sigma-70 factor (ECF subfamily)